MANNTAKTPKLMSSDGDEFVVPEEVAMQSQAIRHMIEDECANNVIPLPLINSRILAMVIEYCMKHVTATEKASDAKDEKMEEGNPAKKPKLMSPKEELEMWDTEFLNVDRDTLYHLIMAANYLVIQSLLDMVCRKVAGMISGKSVEEIRETFGIKNDFTPEEEEEIRSKNSWAFE